MTEITAGMATASDPGEGIDESIQPHAFEQLPVVALGGSAGAIAALEVFFASVPARTGIAYVVVLHLSREHESTLPELLRRKTAMTVLQVTESVRFEPDTVYVIPPRSALRAVDGVLSLVDLPRERHQHVVVDLFFRTLADTHGPHATAIVLSGGDGDGAIGIKRVKERGGLTIAQEPEEAEHGGMPRAAIATGMVDWVLPVGEMAARVLEFHQLEQQIQLPAEQGPQPVTPVRSGDHPDEAALRDVLTFLRTRTGRDFSYYKRATILRRIGRRMQVNGIETLNDYLGCLRMRPGEAGALLQDLLISVTNFFRDADCFATLEHQLPALFHGRSPQMPLRVWVAACATGEEAYSIAMLLSDHARHLEGPPPIQIFATDLDEDAIRVARDGIYPATIEGDISEERLRRYFIKEHRGYRVRRELREMVLFAVHDVLKDSPFSRLALVSCRNLLIYLTRQAQTRALDTFHFALQPGGLLFLGSSESVEDGSALFAVMDKKHRLYAQRATPRIGLPVPAGPGTLALALEAQQTGHDGPVIAGPAFATTLAAVPRPSTGLDGRAASWGELHLKLLEALSPPSILVDSEHDIVHLSPGAGRFLQYAGGEVSRNLLRVIHPSLRIELRAALYQAAQNGANVDVGPLTVALGNETLAVTMAVRPVGNLAPGFVLLLLRSRPVDEPASEPSSEQLPARGDSDPVAHHLDRELERLKSHLRDTVEQYEASTEELKASNEELQAMNEELRSATEELETSREELQSINEELTTVNYELKSKVDELGHSNSDMQNLMDATAIATVFLDREFRITRYTPSAVALFNLIPTDVGRPLSDLTSQLDYADLASDARRVLERLVPIEREVGADGSWYLVRALPYRTLDDRIAGVVLTFVDIGERKRSQEALRRSDERFSAIVDQAAVGVVQLRPDGTITLANRYYGMLLGQAEEDLADTSLLEHIHPDDRADTAVLFAQLVHDGTPFQVEKRCLRRDGAVVWLHHSATVMSGGPDADGAVLLVCTDLTERRRAEEALRESEEKQRLIVDNATEYAIFSADPERRITSWNAGAERLLGYSEAEVLGQRFDLVFTEADRTAGAPGQEVRQAMAQGRANDDREHVRKDGTSFWADGALMPMHDPAGAVVGFVKVLRDRSDARRAQQSLESTSRELQAALSDAQQARSELEAADATKDRFLAVLSHELRNPLAAIHSASQALLASALGEADRTNAARIVARQSGVMATLLSDLLDISRLKYGQLQLQRRPVPLASVIDAALETSRPEIEGSRHVLTISLPDEPVLLDADPVRLGQAVSNLLTNAAKYTPAAGHIELAAEVDGGRLVVTITDDGIGMGEETQAAMFEMFYREARAVESSNVGHGLGIGLALVRSIVELHQGEVRGDSAGPGRGSRFTITLPLVDGLAPQPPAPLPAVARRPRRVLVCDDNRDVAWALVQLLQLEGHAVTLAASGEEALRLADEVEPEAVVLDIGMADIGGVEVARRLRERPWGPQALIVAATGWQTLDDLSPFDAHLVKPVDVQALLALIDRHPAGA